MHGSRDHRSRSARPLPPVAAAAAAVLLAGCSVPVPRHHPGSLAAPVGSAPAALSAGDSLQQDYERVVRAVLPSVVQITSHAGLGSGVVYDTRGDIVTNAHVVGSGRSFKVVLATGESAVTATLVGSFPADDLAVIRLRKPPPGLTPASFGDSSRVQVGQITLAMGNPLGLSGSVAEGIVSAVGRSVNEGSGIGGGTGATIPDMVQTSAAINPGNSGGALVDLSGRVIGIPTLAATDTELGGGEAPGIGFAIPASAVTDIAGQLVRHGRVTRSGRAALGVTVRTVLGGDLQPAGAAVVSVTRRGAARRAGIRAGDVITGVDGTLVTTAEGLSETLASHRPGERVRVAYRRDGRRRTAAVVLGRL